MGVSSPHFRCACLTHPRTPTEDALWCSLLFWRHYESREAALNALKDSLGPYLTQSIEDTYARLATKMRWTDLHRYLGFLSSPALTSVPPDLISQVNIRDSFGCTPLFYAMLVSPEAVRALLAVGANPRIDSAILTWAARTGADLAVGPLVRAGACINESEMDLHRAANFDVAHAIMQDFEQPWRAHRNSDDEESGLVTEVHYTCGLSYSVQYPPAPLDDAEDWSLPILAGTQGDIDVIGTLINRGAMVNKRDHEGRTLLHLVASGKVPNGYRIALELIRHGGWAVDWDALVNQYGLGDEQEESGDENENLETTDGVYEEWDGRGVGCTPLKIAELRLEFDELTEQEREELHDIRDLLEARRLPHDEEYLWSCMDPDFYARMPGAWE